MIGLRQYGLCPIGHDEPVMAFTLMEAQGAQMVGGPHGSRWQCLVGVVIGPEGGAECAQVCLARLQSGGSPSVQDGWNADGGYDGRHAQADHNIAAREAGQLSLMPPFTWLSM